MDIKNVLLTGHRGFIGKNLYKELKSLGLNVYTVEKDFLDDPYWKEVLYNKVKSSDMIFHVGAISDTTLKDSQKMLLYNYEFSKVLIDHAYDLHTKVIYSSLAANEGSGNGIPNNIYGWSKLLVENYGIAKGGNFVALRYFNVYGPGEEHKGKMASMAYQAYKKGEVYLFPGGPTRDFIYIDDVVKANIMAVNAFIGVYDVGTGVSSPFENLVVGMGIKPVKLFYTTEDKIPSWYQFYTKADKNKWLSGWYPEYDLERGTKKYKNYLNKKL